MALIGYNCVARDYRNINWACNICNNYYDIFFVFKNHNFLLFFSMSRFVGENDLVLNKSWFKLWQGPFCEELAYFPCKYVGFLWELMIINWEKLFKAYRMKL